MFCSPASGRYFQLVPRAELVSHKLFPATQTLGSIGLVAYAGRQIMLDFDSHVSDSLVIRKIPASELGQFTTR